MTLKLNSLVSTDEGKDWAEVCEVFKDLVGTHLVSEEQRMRAQLTGSQVTLLSLLTLQRHSFILSAENGVQLVPISISLSLGTQFHTVPCSNLSARSS